MEVEKVKDRATLSVSIDRNVERAFRAHCNKKRFIMSRIAEDLFREWLEKEGVVVDPGAVKKDGGVVDQGPVQ
jgi:hypothetical protein